MNILERLIMERGGSLQGHHHVQAFTDRPAPPRPPHLGENPALARILELTGETLESLRAAAPPEPEGKVIREVPESPEFIRIRDLPRRSLDSGEEWAQKLTHAFSTPWGTMALRPLQGLALYEICTFGGMLGPIRVGGGKTLISYLAPKLAGARRPLLIVPAKLKKKTRKEFKTLSYHWAGPDPEAYRIESYELIGRPQSGNQLDEKGNIISPGLLERLRPDLIFLDEAHKAKNKAAAVTRRLRRYLQDNPGCRVIAVSGTLISRSLKDFAHIAQWCLPRACPLPIYHGDLEAWSGALDEKLSEGQSRVDAGALRQLMSPEEEEKSTLGAEEEISALRQAFRRRMVETPGVVATSDGPLACSLSVRVHEPLKEDPAVEKAFAHFRAFHETPAGMPCPDPMEYKRHALELAMGFEYVWDPQPPEEWRLIRKAWAKFCRDVIKYNRRGIDSEAQVVQAVQKGLYPDHGLLAEWRRIKPTFEPRTVPVWFSSEALETAAKWMEKHPKGIVWTKHVAFAEALAELTKVPYYGQDGKDARTKVYIEEHPKKGAIKKGSREYLADPVGPIIASLDSNAEGRNLQFKWCENLVMTPPTLGKVWEQLLGRTHRDYQPEDEVDMCVYLACREHFSDFFQAREDSKAQQDLTGQVQKLMYADLDYPDISEISQRTGARWGKGVFKADPGAPPPVDFA